MNLSFSGKTISTLDMLQIYHLSNIKCQPTKRIFIYGRKFGLLLNFFNKLLKVIEQENTGCEIKRFKKIRTK